MKHRSIICAVLTGAVLVSSSATLASEQNITIEIESIDVVPTPGHVEDTPPQTETQPPETETESETRPAAETESESGTEEAPGTEDVTETEDGTEEATGAEDASETEDGTEEAPETEDATEAESDVLTEEYILKKFTEQEILDMDTLLNGLRQLGLVMQEIFGAESEAEPETELVTELQTEAEPQTETELVTEPESETVTEEITETESEPVTEAEPQTESAPETELATELQTETEPQTETELAAEPESETVTEEITEMESELLTETEPQTEAELTTESESELVTEEITEAESELVTETEFQTEPAPETEPTTELQTETEPQTETELVTEPETEPPIEEITQGLYEISSAVAADFVLDIRHCTVQDTDSQAVQLYRSLDVNQQKFYLEALPGGLYRISALHTGDALTISEDGTSVAAALMEHPEGGCASQQQTWILEHARNNLYYIRTEAGQYLTLDAEGAYSGAPVTLKEYAGSYAQMWRFDSTWISQNAAADTDLASPYGEDGKYRNLCIVLQCGSDFELLTAADLNEHVTENDEHQLVLDPEYLDSFVAQLAEKYDSQGQPQNFRTTQGEEITLTEGNFGWKLDTAATKELLAEHLETNHTEHLEAVWEHHGSADSDGNDIGDSYVEVDLMNQKVYLYKDGKQLLETDCVSGTQDTDRETPEGVYTIYYMQSPDTLNGPGYSEFVNFWMPFFQGYGLHDATWRSEFGGDIYLTDGSHGCINLPYDAAEFIYNTVDIGYPVVLYR